MGSKDRDNFVVLQGDVLVVAERVRAVLEGWGLEENAIYPLLAEGRCGDAPRPKAAPRSRTRPSRCCTAARARQLHLALRTTRRVPTD